MVFKKRFKRYRRRFKKRTYKRKMKGPLAKLPKEMKGPEFKYADLNYTSVGVDNAGYISLGNGIDQGTSSSTRIGNMIKVHAIELQFSATSNNPKTIKFSLFYDKQTQFTTPQPADLFTAIGGAFYPWNVRAIKNRDRFVTLYNRQYSITPQFSGQNAVKTFKHFIKIPKGVACIYSGSGSTVTSIAMGGIFLYMCSDDVFGVTNTAVSGTLRIKYTDD